MFGAFIMLSSLLAFGALVNENCKQYDLNAEECLEYFQENSVNEYPDTTHKE